MIHSFLPRDEFQEVGHRSTAEYKGAELIDHANLLLWIVVSKVRSKLPKEFALSVFLCFQTQANQRGNRFTHACVESPGVLRDPPAEIGKKSNGVSRTALVGSLLPSEAHNIRMPQNT